MSWPNEKTLENIQINYSRNKEQNNSEQIVATAAKFQFEDCKEEYWNPEQFSLMYKTPLWEQASVTQKIKLNQIAWVAHYANVVSNEPALIFLNQACASGLSQLEDFRIAANLIDLECEQSRAHVEGFRKVTEAFESEFFGQRVFTTPVAGPFYRSQSFAKTNHFKKIFHEIKSRSFALWSADSPFLASQYFTLRGLKSLNTRTKQYQLAQIFLKDANANIPAKLSYFYYTNESFRLKTSALMGLDLGQTQIRSKGLSQQIANFVISNFQNENYNFSTALRGVGWYDPSLFRRIYKILRAPLFGMSHPEAMQMMRLCFTRESEGMHASYNLHEATLKTYKDFLKELNYLSRTNKELKIMGRNSLMKSLSANRQAFEKFERLQLNLLPRLPGPQTQTIRTLEISST